MQAKTRGKFLERKKKEEKDGVREKRERVICLQGEREKEKER